MNSAASTCPSTDSPQTLIPLCCPERALEGEISAKTDVVWFRAIFARRRRYICGKRELIVKMPRRAGRTKEWIAFPGPGVPRPLAVFLMAFRVDHSVSSIAGAKFLLFATVRSRYALGVWESLLGRLSIPLYARDFRIAALLIAAMVIDGGTQALGLRMSKNWLRFASGIGFSLGCGGLVERGIQHLCNM